MKTARVLALVGTVMLAYRAAAHFPGDVNLDGQLDVVDARIILNHASRSITLMERSLINADLAKESNAYLLPKVNSADALLALRLVSGALQSATFPPPLAPVLSVPIGSGNPVVISGTCEVGSTLLFFVTAPPADPPQAKRVALSKGGISCPIGGTIPSTEVYLLFDGENQIHAVALNNGFPSRASNVRSATFSNALSHTLPSTLTGPLVLTPGATDEAYTYSGPTPLTIQGTVVVGPGVDILISPSRTIQVGTVGGAAGTLIVHGSTGTGEEVVFDRNGGTGTWGGIDIQNGVGSDFLHTKILHATIGINSTQSVSFRHGEIVTGSTNAIGIQLSQIGVTVPQLTLQSSKLSGLGFSGDTGVKLDAVGFGSSLISTIADNEISQFAEAIEITGGARHRIERNLIRNNATGILVANASTEQGSPQILGNTIRNNNNYGIKVLPGFYSSTFPVCQTNAECWSADVPTLHWNVFRSNGTPSQNDPEQGHLFLGGGYIGNSTHSTYPDVDNRLIDAQFNDWGSNVVTEVMGQIFDRLDPITGTSANVRPLVSFTPFWKTGTLPPKLDHSFIVGSLALTDDVGESTGIDFVNYPAKTVLGPLIAPRNSPGGKFSTILAGSVIKMKAGAPIVVLGSLTVNGTTSAPVTLKGDTASPTRGFWKGIQAEPASAILELSHVKIQDAEVGITVRRNARLKYIGSDAFGTNPSSIVSSFSVGAIEFDTCGNTCWVEGIVIDDDINHLMHSETTGVFGIRSLNASPFIAGNLIRDVITGIHLRGTNLSTVENNRIVSNVFGFWIEEVGGNHPNPMIRFNRFESNAGTAPIPVRIAGMAQEQLCSPVGAALCLSGAAVSGSAPVLNARDNYWGVDPAPSEQVRSVVTHSNALHRAVDQALYWIDIGGTSHGSSTFFSTTITGVTVDKKVFSPLPVTGPPQSVTISFTLLQNSDVTLRIYRERDLLSTEGLPADTPVRTITSNGLLVGQRSIQWDGRDSSLPTPRVVADEAYSYVLSTSDGSVYNPRRFESYGGESSNPAVVGDIGAGCSPNTTALDPPFDPNNPNTVPGGCSGFLLPSPALAFEPVINDFYEFNYRLIKHPNRGSPFDSRVTVEVRDGSEGGPVLAKPWDKRPIRVSTSGAENDHAVAFTWNGRNDATGEILPPNSGTTRKYSFGYVIPQALKPNSVIVTGALPVIDGGLNAVDTDPLFHEVKIDPYLVHHSYDQVSTVTFKVNRISQVNLYVLPPEKVALSDSVQVINYGEIAANALVDFEWNGRPSSQATGTSNNGQSTADGLYTFVIEAIAKNGAVLETNLVSLYRGAIQVRQ